MLGLCTAQVMGFVFFNRLHFLISAKHDHIQTKSHASVCRNQIGSTTTQRSANEYIIIGHIFRVERGKCCFSVKMEKLANESENMTQGQNTNSFSYNLEIKEDRHSFFQTIIVSYLLKNFFI